MSHISVRVSAVGFLVLSALTSATGWATPPPQMFEYAARIPATSRGCQSEADRLGTRFQAATGIKPDQSVCRDVVTFTADSRTYTLFSLAVSYTATVEAALYSADYGLFDSYGLPNEEQGFFVTYASCLGALDAARTEFEGQTALPAVSLSCLPGRASYNPNYVLRVDGFGAPAKKLRLVELKFIGQTDSATEAQVDELIRALGGEIVAHRDAQRLLYGGDDFAVKYDDLGRLNSKDQCQAEVNLAQDIFTQLGSQSTRLFCLPGYGTSFYLEAVREGFFLLQGDMGSGHPRYFSFSECMNALAQTNFGGMQAVGGLCHASDFADGQYELELYSRL